MTLKESIIESATEVYNELGGGHLESVYHDAMCVGFNSRGIKYKFKATSWKTSPKERAQLRSYIHTLGFESGLIINFLANDSSEPSIEQVPLDY